VTRRELDKFYGQLERVIAQLKSLNRSDNYNRREIQEPPVLVKNILEIVWLLAEANTNWKATSPLLGDSLFISKVTSKYSEERRAAPPVLESMQTYIESNPKFEEGEVSRVVGTIKVEYKWITALYNYEIVIKKPELKRANARAIRHSLQESKDNLGRKQAQETQLEDKLDGVRENVDMFNREKAHIEGLIGEPHARVAQASKLGNMLAMAHDKWEKEIQGTHSSMDCVVGDAFLTYFGPLPLQYRKTLTPTQ
jgi:dynein heavy chain